MYATSGNQTLVFVIALAVILSAIFRLVLEVSQLFVLKYRYMFEFSNWMELTLFAFSIIFACLFWSRCLCPTGWQWQLGTIAVFLAWIDLMLFFDKFPWIGIYVLMFVKVVSTFVKALFVSFLLVIAFALTLYMCFYEPSIKVHLVTSMSTFGFGVSNKLVVPRPQVLTTQTLNWFCTLCT
jgi:transient receptor potential cation channel subfamily A protein 1